jgi:hypothetical protein
VKWEEGKGKRENGTGSFAVLLPSSLFPLPSYLTLTTPLGAAFAADTLAAQARNNPVVNARNNRWAWRDLKNDIVGKLSAPAKEGTAGRRSEPNISPGPDSREMGVPPSLSR